VSQRVPALARCNPGIIRSAISPKEDSRGFSLSRNLFKIEKSLDYASPEENAKASKLCAQKCVQVTETSLFFFKKGPLHPRHDYHPLGWILAEVAVEGSASRGRHALVPPLLRDFRSDWRMNSDADASTAIFTIQFPSKPLRIPRVPSFRTRRERLPSAARERVGKSRILSELLILNTPRVIRERSTRSSPNFWYCLSN